MSDHDFPENLRGWDWNSGEPQEEYELLLAAYQEAVDLLAFREQIIAGQAARIDGLMALAEDHDAVVRRYRDDKSALTRELDHFKDQAVLQHRERRQLLDRIELLEKKAKPTEDPAP